MRAPWIVDRETLPAFRAFLSDSGNLTCTKFDIPSRKLNVGRSSRKRLHNPQSCPTTSGKPQFHSIHKLDADDDNGEPPLANHGKFVVNLVSR